MVQYRLEEERPSTGRRKHFPVYSLHYQLLRWMVHEHHAETIENVPNKSNESIFDQIVNHTS